MSRSPVSAVNATHFRIVRGSSGKSSLNTLVPGICVIFFKTQTCDICKATEPEFRKLAMQDKRVDVYAICDMTSDQNKEIARLSQQTVTPITTVPLIILYNNGTPIARQSGRKDMNTMVAFVSQALKEIQNQEAASTPIQMAPSQSGLRQSSTTRGTMQGPPQPPLALQQAAKNRQPEFGTIPNVQNRQRPGGGYMIFGGDQEDPNVLLMPPGITPSNKPWDALYRQIGD